MKRWAALLFGLLIAPGVSAQESDVLYKDSHWGVVRQDKGRTCIIVLNTSDRQHAFHFLVDGVQRTAAVGILRGFLPDLSYLRASETSGYLDLGPRFARELTFKPASDGTLEYIAATLEWRDLGLVASALEGSHGVTMSFTESATWRIPAPERQMSSPAIDDCLKAAVSGSEATSFHVHNKPAP